MIIQSFSGLAVTNRVSPAEISAFLPHHHLLVLNMFGSKELCRAVPHPLPTAHNYFYGPKLKNNGPHLDPFLSQIIDTIWTQRLENKDTI